MGRSNRIEFCCFGVPLINMGSYTICLQFMFVAACTIILALVPPTIVATMGALPSGFPKYIVAVLALISLICQVVGIVAIKREAPRLYRTYIRINFVLTLLVIVATLAFFAVAAARHSVALQSCVAAYGATPAGSSSMGSSALQNLGSTICNIFIWVQVGFMGLLIAVIGLTQLYLCAVQRAYGREMRRAETDRKTYIGNTNGDEIPLATRGSGIWDAPQTGNQRTGYGQTAYDLNHSSDDVPYGNRYEYGNKEAGEYDTSYRNSRYGGAYNSDYDTYGAPEGGSDGFGYRRSQYQNTTSVYGGNHARGMSG
jgi:hypothetical protein